MKRTIIKIDESLCNGCGLCIEGCHEGALQLIDGKARMISDLYCDGLGACIPECPVGAISLEEREAEPYDEIKVMERIAPKGEATVLAHLQHLIDHDQHEFVAQGIQYIKAHKLPVKLDKLKIPARATMLSDDSVQHIEGASAKVSAGTAPQKDIPKPMHGGGCPGARMMSFDAPSAVNSPSAGASNGHGIQDQASALRQWPVQLHLVNPTAPYFKEADVLLAADCVAFSMGNFHSKYLSGKGLAIACPKLDSGKDTYVEKLTAMIDHANINTLTVMMMEVPCCSGILQMAKTAVQNANRKVPVKALVVGLNGQIQTEQWI